MPNEYLVVDFRPSSFAPYVDLTEVLLENYWVVVYDIKAKSSKVYKYDKDKKCIWLGNPETKCNFQSVQMVDQ